MSKAPQFDGTQPCLNVDPDMFFPELPEKPNAQDKRIYSIEVAAAKGVCNSCPFIVPCLEYALHNDVQGIWGGTVDSDRRAIRKTRKLPPPKSMSSITASWFK